MSSKLDWSNFFDMTFWEIYCLIFNEDGDPVFPDDLGKSAYTAVNTSRRDQGLQTTDDVPNETYDTSTGHVEHYISPNNFLYINPDIGPTDTVFVTVYGCPYNTSPDLGPGNVRNLQFITSYTATPLSIAHLDDAIKQSGLFTSGQYGLLEFRSGFPGSIARSRQRRAADV